MKANWFCHRTQSRLWDYCAGTLPSQEAQRIEAHLRRCPACRIQRDRAAATVPLVVELRTSVSPPSATDYADLLQRIETRRRMEARETGWLRPLTLQPLAGVAVLGLVALTTRQFVRPAAIEPATKRSVAYQASPGTPSPPHAAPEFAIHAEPVVPPLLPADVPPAGVYPIEVRGADNAGASEEAKAAVAEAKAAVTVAPLITHRPFPLRVVVADPEQEDGSGGHGPLRGRTNPHHNTGRDVAVMHAGHIILPEDLTPDAEPNRAFVMPVMRPDDPNARCSFVMEGIPTSTLAGQAGTAAAEANNPETGKAL